MAGTIRNMREARAWQRKYDPGTPKVGDRAPNFELYDTSGENSVRLADFHGRMPVALVFGSFT